MYEKNIDTNSDVGVSSEQLALRFKTNQGIGFTMVKSR